MLQRKIYGSKHPPHALSLTLFGKAVAVPLELPKQDGGVIDVVEVRSQGFNVKEQATLKLALRFVDPGDKKAVVVEEDPIQATEMVGVLPAIDPVSDCNTKLGFEFPTKVAEDDIVNRPALYLCPIVIVKPVFEPAKALSIILISLGLLVWKV